MREFPCIMFDKIIVLIYLTSPFSPTSISTVTIRPKPKLISNKVKCFESTQYLLK